MIGGTQNVIELAEAKVKKEEGQEVPGAIAWEYPRDKPVVDLSPTNHTGKNSY